MIRAKAIDLNPVSEQTSTTHKLRWWQRLLQRFGFYGVLTETLEVRDCHGLHYRRCAELVKECRRFPTYQIYLRYPKGKLHLWANARSITSLLGLGVPGYRQENGERPSLVEARVSGFNPAQILRRIRRILEAAPYRYQSIYEAYERAQLPPP